VGFWFHGIPHSRFLDHHATAFSEKEEPETGACHSPLRQWNTRPAEAFNLLKNPRNSLQMHGMNPLISANIPLK
jgi:hypothetical protein